MGGPRSGTNRITLPEFIVLPPPKVTARAGRFAWSGSSRCPFSCRTIGPGPPQGGAPVSIGVRRSFDRRIDGETAGVVAGLVRNRISQLRNLLAGLGGTRELAHRACGCVLENAGGSRGRRELRDAVGSPALSASIAPLPPRLLGTRTSRRCRRRGPGAGARCPSHLARDTSGRAPDSFSQRTAARRTAHVC